jgi:hypothetical protein
MGIKQKALTRIIPNMYPISRFRVHIHEVMYPIWAFRVQYMPKMDLLIQPLKMKR